MRRRTRAVHQDVGEVVGEAGYRVHAVRPAACCLLSGGACALGGGDLVGVVGPLRVDRPLGRARARQVDAKRARVPLVAQEELAVQREELCVDLAEPRGIDDVHHMWHEATHDEHADGRHNGGTNQVEQY
jgi:hypothetical protein